MYISLILFFISLFGIGIMVGHKIFLIRNGQLVKAEHHHIFIPDLEKMKHTGLRNAKKAGYIGTFIILRLSILSSNFIKTKSLALFKIVKEKINPIEKITEQKEVSKYLKAISEYRRKIRQMKHKIKEEEGIE